MKISTKGRYGLRALLDLAINSSNDHVALKSIAERQSISESYLEQVFSILRKAGLVTSIKGAQGGYLLEKTPSEITIGSVLRLLEGDLSVVDNKSNTEGVQNLFIQSIKSRVWDAMDESINSVVNNITLDDLITEYRKLSTDDSYMFYI